MIHSQETSCLTVKQKWGIQRISYAHTTPSCCYLSNGSQGLTPAQTMSLGEGVLRRKANDGQITNDGGPAQKGLTSKDPLC